MKKEDIQNLSNKELIEVYKCLIAQKKKYDEEIRKISEVTENEERVGKSL